MLATGVLPIMLVISRPEQPFFLAAMGMALLTLPAVRQQISARRAWLICTAIVLLSVVAVSYQLKGLLYSSFGLACVVVLARGRQHIVPRAMAGLAIVVLNLLSARYWLDRFDCPTNAVMQGELEQLNVVASLQAGNGTFELILRQLGGAHIFNYAELAAIHPYPMASWMPLRVFSTAEGIVSFGMTYLLWGTVSLLALYALVQFVRRSGWPGLWTPQVLLIGALFGLTFSWGFVRITRNIYEAMHILPAWIMLLLLAWTLKPAGPAAGQPAGETDGSLVSKKALRLVATLLLAAGVLSQAILIGRMGGPLWEAAHDPGRLPLQRYSISLADYPSVRADIQRAMQQASMDQSATGPDGRLNRLLVDDLTYLELQRSYLPIYALGVMGPWNGPIKDPAPYLVSRDSDGIVASCASLWQAAADVAARSGEICAINRQQLQQLAGGRPFVPASYSEDVPPADGACPELPSIR